MSVALQQVVVGALVIACALFAAWRLATVRLRLRALEVLGACTGLSRAHWLVRLRERTRAQELRACGGCSGGATPGADAPRNRTPGALRR